MSSHNTAFTDWEDKAERLYRDALQVLEGDAIDNVPDEAIQKLLTMALKLYVRKIESDEYFPAPFAGEHEVTPTEVVKAVIEMLEAVDVEIFELGLWKSFGTVK